MKKITKLMLAVAAVCGMQGVALADERELVKPDSLYTTEVVEGVSVSIKMPKQHFGLKRQPLSSSVMGEAMLEREQIHSVKDLSAIMPNFYQPDYGSKMTSSIYVRGFGARIDQPVIGVTVDGVPYLNKNNYDFDMMDVVRVELLRGPQSTLYGRNTMGGQMNVYTLSPMNYTGMRGSVEYGSGNTINGKLMYYGRSASGKFGYSVGGYYNRTDGFFDNTFDGSNVDWGQSSGGRLRLVWDLGSNWEIDNTASVGYTDEGGYAYAMYDAEKDVVGPINYNSPSGYMRLNVSDGLMLSHAGEKYKFTATTSLQYMHDRMRMDNDLTPASIFTLAQEQKEWAVTEDVVFRTNDMSRRWQWLTGAYGFYKNIAMNAPVNIFEEGINNLIIDNIPDKVPIKKGLSIDPFTIASNFDLPTCGLALYHESSLKVGERWRFTAGLRLDYEASKMNFDNYASVHYVVDMSAMRPGMIIEKDELVEFKGDERLDYLEVLPKLAVNYTTSVGDLYVIASRGYKAGGFNTQIFSDILQNKIMGQLSGGNSGSSSPYDEAAITTYKPEYSWNYELGGHFMLAQGRLGLDFAAFWIECRDQQLTVFPEGLTTGRMMSNAGKSRSRGVETTLEWQRREPMRGLSVVGSYGYTNARFVEFNDGVNDYADNYLPYAPQHTASLGASYRFFVSDNGLLKHIDLNASWQGAGKIYWNEANTLAQNFYSQLNASLMFQFRDVALSLWGRNLTNTDFYTFYFKSMNNNFYNHGKPCRIGATLSFKIL